MRSTTRSSSRTVSASQKGPKYELYAVNFYDNGLNAVRDEFIKRIKSGLRRPLFVIDLQTEIRDAEEYNKTNARLTKPRKPISKPTDPNIIVMEAIQEFCKQYDYITKRIEEELRFNLYKYWLANMNVQALKKRPSKAGTKRGPNQKIEKGGAGDQMSLDIECYGLAPKEHNKVGKGEPLSKRLYIQDQPLSAKLFIVIIGQMDNTFYNRLLLQKLPLRAVIHFLPEECAYDILVPRPRREKFLTETIEMINKSIHSMRKRINTKQIGLFQQQLPVMSTCLASKYSDDIFNQLSWFLYDVETLYDWYQQYYVKPYHEINVKLSPMASLTTSFNMAESLSMQGHYLKTPIAAAAEDDATLYMYMESLLCTFGPPRELLSEMEVLLLANPSSMVQTRILDKIKVYTHAFLSTIKLNKLNRLFIEKSNSLLYNLLIYSEQEPLRNLYHVCLEYNILRRYFTSGYIIKSIGEKPYSGDLEPLYLHKYANLFLTDDSVTQRLIKLVDEYPDFKVEQAQPNVRLFTFKRVLNEIFETEKETVIPTRLCFRDFTLYEMEQFLKDLVTPEMYKEAHEKRMTEAALVQLSNTTMKQTPQPAEVTVRMKDGVEITIDFGLFIRPNSLKAQRYLKVGQTQSITGQASKPSTENRRRSTRNKSFKQGSGFPSKSDSVFEARIDQKSIHEGLTFDHPMLTGYNLDDARQTIKTKTSKYCFEEGKLQLFEERWNFTHTNKTLTVLLNKLQLFLHCPIRNVQHVSRNFRLKTDNDISLRVLSDNEECAKVVVNYPNGLSIFCHEKDAVQLWNLQETYQDERRRIYTPYGCVIVHYNSDDVVLIMRYNGEVFQLYNYLEEAEEEGEGLSELAPLVSTSSTGENIVQNSKKNKKNNAKKANSGVPDKNSVKSNDSEIKMGKRKWNKSQYRAVTKQATLDSIEYELGYLQFIMTLYKLSYLHLKLTTSVGKVVHVLTTGKVYEGRPIVNEEWHDYFANEDYSIRSDGVKMIWDAVSLKCYHADGTVITTTTNDTVESSVDDELDKEVTESSSHENEKSTEAQRTSFKSNTMYATSDTGIAFDQIFQTSLEPSDDSNSLIQQKKMKQKTTMTDHLVSEEAEEIYIFDPTFITYVPGAYAFHHRIYAGILFLIDFVDNDLKITTELQAADDLRVKVYQEILISENSSVEEECEKTDARPEEQITEISSAADSDEWNNRNVQFSLKNIFYTNYSLSPPKTSHNMMTIFEIECNNIKMKVTKNDISFNTEIRRFGCSENVCIIRETISFKLEYTQSLSAIFRAWVKQLVSFINCCCPKVKTSYFVELTLDDCKKRGFELLPKLPPLTKYNFCASNVVLDIEKITSMKQRLQNYYQWYENDMRKFPRFRKPIKRPSKPVVDYPSVLAVNVFVEIPHQLATTDRIHQFIDPFDKITFKKLRSRLNESVIFHLHPHLRLLLHKEMSTRSWKRRLMEHKRQLFLEQQRLGLYIAMLKHKVYPNYFQFMNQFYGHVRNIDFFEFMTMKCSEKLNPGFYEKKAEETETPIDKTKEAIKRKNRKKCLCPKYPF